MGGPGSGKRTVVPNARVKALEAWPAAPRRFTEIERDAWADLGDMLLPLRVCADSDVYALSVLARLMAKTDAMLSGPTEDINASLLNALSMQLKAFGLTPAGRRLTSALPGASPRRDDTDPLGE